MAAQDDPDYSNNRVEVETKVLKGTELQADLSLTKSDSPDRVEPGQQLIYSLNIRNNGPSPATGVRLSDKLPSGLTFSSVASSQGECEESKGSVSCELEEIPPGSSAEVRIAVRVTTSDESVTNVASVKANEDDPDGDNNTAKEETEIVGISPLGTNLALIKSDNKDPAEPGSTLIYSLTVDNEGPDDAVDVVLTDELPPLVTFLAAETSQGLCSESKGMVTCKLGVLPRGEAVKTEIAVNIGAAAAGTVLINTAAVGAGQEDLNNDNNIARETTTVLRGTVFGSDVYVEKQDSKDPVEAEERFAYLLTVGNAGPGPASGVTLTDELPPELIFIAGKSSQGECNESGGTVRCELGSLARGESAEVVVSVQVDPFSPATRVLNHARVGATETDPNQSNNEAEEETTLLGPLAPEADVSLSKRASPNPVQAGSSLSYKLTVRNAGPDPASQVRLVDSLPAEMSFVVVESSQGGCSHSSGEVGCDLGNLPAGSSATVAISVTVSQEAVGILRNRAVAGAAEDDPNPGNNAAATETTVLGGNGLQAADLSVSKSASPDPVEAGGSLTYRITIRNGGPDKASGVEVSDSLPSDVSFVSAGASQGKCSHSQGKVGCDLGTLDVGASASVSINVDVGKSARGSIGNTASAGASEPDPNPSNNSDKTTTEVTEPPPVADIAVGKSASGTVEAGKSLTYRITVRNSGPDKASGVELRDSLPSDVSFVSAGASQGKCSHSQGKVGCDLGTLDVGATASVSINVNVSTSARGSISNTASSSSAEVDPDTSNNSDTTTTEIKPCNFLSVI